jgi:hypothetical protein
MTLKSEKASEWGALAQQLLEAADCLFHASDLGDHSDPLQQVKVSALCILCRSTNHFAAFRLLMENGFIVEARTLVRSCYENLFWLGGLKDKGTDFLDQMEGEDTRGRRALSGELLKWWKDREGFEDTSNKLEEFIETLKAKPTAKILNEQVAKDAGLGAAYTMYRVLSNDSAHPSARSLSRHLQIDPDGLRTVCGDSLWSEEAEDLDTWSLGCGVLLMVCVATDLLP